MVSYVHLLESANPQRLPEAELGGEEESTTRREQCSREHLHARREREAIEQAGETFKGTTGRRGGGQEEEDEAVGGDGRGSVWRRRNTCRVNPPRLPVYRGRG